MENEKQTWKVGYFGRHPDAGNGSCHAEKQRFSLGEALVTFNRPLPAWITEQTAWVRLTHPDGRSELRENPDFVDVVDVEDFDADWRCDVHSWLEC